MKLTEVRRSGPTTLDLAFGNSTVYVRGNAVIYHRRPCDEYIEFVLGSDKSTPRFIYVAPDDFATIQLLDSLRKQADQSVVERLLAQQVKVEEKPKEFLPGRVFVESMVLTVVTGDGRSDFSMTDTNLPKVMFGSERADGHYEVTVRMPDRSNVLVLVAPDHSDELLRARAMLRPSSAPTSSSVGSESKVRWQYRVVKNMTANRLETTLNEMGRTGWELVSIAGMDGVMTLTGNKIYAVLKKQI